MVKEAIFTLQAGFMRMVRSTNSKMILELILDGPIALGVKGEDNKKLRIVVISRYGLLKFISKFEMKINIER